MFQVLGTQPGTMVLDIATDTPSLVIVDAQPVKHMFNLQRDLCLSPKTNGILAEARLAQPAERKALNLVVVGSSPTVGVLLACVAKQAYQSLIR